MPKSISLNKIANFQSLNTTREYEVLAIKKLQRYWYQNSLNECDEDMQQRQQYEYK